MRGRQRGALLLEVLVALAVSLVGLWGLLALQHRLQQLTLESVWHNRAVLLVQDMAARIATQYPSADAYVTSEPLGAGADCPHPSGDAPQRDRAAWCRMLRGEEAGAGLPGGRGCVETVTREGQPLLRVTVAWQARRPLQPPPANITCGRGRYDQPDGSACARPGAEDSCRRAVATLIRVPAGLMP